MTPSQHRTLDQMLAELAKGPRNTRSLLAAIQRIDIRDVTPDAIKRAHHLLNEHTSTGQLHYTIGQHTARIWALGPAPAVAPTPAPAKRARRKKATAVIAPTPIAHLTLQAALGIGIPAQRRKGRVIAGLVGDTLSKPHRARA